MQINLSSEIEHYLQSKVSTGFYSNASEVVRDAIRWMWEDDQKLERLKAALQVGDEQIQRGEGVIYSSSRLDAITEKAFINARAGKEISSDVTG